MCVCVCKYDVHVCSHETHLEPNIISSSAVHLNLQRVDLQQLRALREVIRTVRITAGRVQTLQNLTHAHTHHHIHKQDNTHPEKSLTNKHDILYSSNVKRNTLTSWHSS